VEKLFRYGAFTKNRVEAFSDGIFAIIVTLLILEKKVPHIGQPVSSAELAQVHSSTLSEAGQLGDLVFDHLHSLDEPPPAL
jgi:uncharacterized membrane protein